MKKFLLAATAALALVGCQTVEALRGVTVTPTQVYIAANAFDALEATATNYVKLPLCTAGQTFVKNGCSSRSAIVRLSELVHVGRADRDQLEAWARSGASQPGLTGLYSGLQAAVDGIKLVLKDYGAQS